jgi:RNA polymerase sigma-70 factor, ECF subfamily
LASQLEGEIAGAGARVEVDSVRAVPPPEPGDRGPAPSPVYIEAQEVIQQVVSRRNLGEDLLNLRFPSRALFGSRTRNRRHEVSGTVPLDRVSVRTLRPESALGTRETLGVPDVKVAGAGLDAGAEIHPLDYAAASDKELAQWAEGGRERAFSELLRRYERPVFSLIYRMVRDRTLAEDLSHEAFIRAFNAIGSYDPRYKFSSWIFKIANNHTIDHLRKRRLDTVSIHGSPYATSVQEEEQTRLVVESRDENPEEYVEHRELGSQIERAIGELRPEYRTVILLRHVEGYAYDEISEIMDLPLGTVKTYLHRARGELKELLAHLTS